MSTKIRTKISKRNKWWIPEKRYLELYWFCQQYEDWIRERAILLSKGVQTKSYREDTVQETNYKESKVEEAAIRLAELNRRIKIVENTAREADPGLFKYILLGVTSKKGFTYMETVLDIPCCKVTYYDRYRRFYYLLDKEKV